MFVTWEMRSDIPQHPVQKNVGLASDAAYSAFLLTRNVIRGGGIQAWSRCSPRKGGHSCNCSMLRKHIQGNSRSLAQVASDEWHFRGSSEIREQQTRELFSNMCEEVRILHKTSRPIGIGYTVELDARQKHPPYNVTPCWRAIGSRDRKRNKRFPATRFSSRYP